MTTADQRVRLLRTVLAGLLLVAGCARPSEVLRQTDTTRSPPDSRPAATAGIQVVIDNFTFSPAELTVAVGTKVTWVNHDDVPHTVTSTQKPRQIESPTLDSDDSFSHVFTAAGNYEYYCAVHPKMTGRIIVK